MHTQKNIKEIKVLLSYHQGEKVSILGIFTRAKLFYFYFVSEKLSYNVLFPDFLLAVS